ncbi:MAG: response regulator [Hyphomonas sp.]|uniref:PAS domain-containing hybrid sensor histidine kinase/response regulator n=1 Tax=Hyphomonas sp. TaxID=87 RepID=UPI001833F4D3|nr:PAS domain-containing hybrid sensor histidine kinase/response regulator [Hyphomonas sp.]MBA3068316.1 response regulator [Hyphomonas sp.]MBU4060818.1 response regulator [Alphaproteobacteria bacterium]MBU4164802.1 response regulator [Alphaproteobacteria bacterium]
MKKETEAFDLSQVLGGTDDTGTSAEGRPPGQKVDLLQLAFWGCLLLSIAAASVSLARPHASGATGSILLITMASGGLVFLLWTVRGAGRFIGLFPERGAAARIANAGAPRFPWIEALDEAVLVTESGGAPVAANPAYDELAALALVTGPSENGPVTVDRLFGASPGLAAPVYRLSKAAKAGVRRRELLPPVALGPEQVPAQFEVTVSPLPRGRVLWRIRRIAGQIEATGAADLKSLYVEDAPMGFFAARPDGTITYANGYLRELLGLPESAKNIRIDDIMRPEFVKLLGRDRKSGAPGRADIQLRARDGVEIPVQAITTWSGRGADANGRTILLPSPQVLNGEGDRFALQGASRPMRADGDPMFDDAPFGAVRLEGDRVDGAIILDANRALMELSGGRATPGSRFSDLFVSDEEGQNALSTALVQAVDKPVSLRIAGQDAQYVNVFVTLNAAGRPSVAYVVDISEHRQLEQRLAHGEKMQAIGKIAGRIAHEINNMLQITMGNQEALVARHPVGDPSFDNLKAINEATVRSRDLVRGLLAYAREQTFKREVFSTTDFLTEFSILLRGVIDERITLEVNHGRDVPWIRADKSQLETAIINLVTNARDAMLSHRDGGKLVIRTSRTTGREAHAKGFDYVEDGDYLLIEVEDTGGGIPKSLQEKIFQPFFTTKEKGYGTGLGLATVFGIIKQSGGYIQPVSTAGKGTNFHIYLPALPAAEIPAPIDQAAEQKAQMRPLDLSGRGRILVIEDEAGVRDIAVSVLRSRGYEVEEAQDGEEALEIINAKPGEFDLVISDVVMPGMNGPTLIKQARVQLGHARVIFISGYAEQELAKQLDDRAVSFLPKPFSVRQLSELVKREIGTPQQEAA